VALSLLREIQASLLQEGQDIGPILLKLRFLASRLGSDTLEEWVKHESEGYPEAVEVPGYRKISVSYKATFSGPAGSGIRNAPIPPYLIEKYADKRWTSIEMRQSIAAVDHLLRSENEGSFRIDASNLILSLQGKIYEHYACNSVDGEISRTCLIEIQNAVRAKILELTIQLEKSIPAAAEITLGPLQSPATKDKEIVTQITNQVIHGNVTNITSTGDSAQLHVNNIGGDVESFRQALEDAGIAKPDAVELAKIVASEKGGNRDEPFGTKAKAWIADNISKAVDGTWKAGIAVATKVLTEAALRYYGLK
jgi:hypothetical protein